MVFIVNMGGAYGVYCERGAGIMEFIVNMGGAYGVYCEYGWGLWGLL